VGGRLRFWFAIAATAVGMALGTSPAAEGAFPGRNGLLAVQQSTGQGIVLVTPGGAVVRRVCDQPTLCGRAVEPRWSPNGLALAFRDVVSSRIGIVAPDGSCLWCLLGDPLTTLHGTQPTFVAGGRSLTVSGGIAGTRAGLWRIPLTGGSAATVLSGAASGAAWSSSGELAIVRHAAVWVRGVPPHRQLRRLVAGTAPNWSPNGKQLAVVRQGWIRVVRASGGAGNRVARGTAPVFSPDGRQLAYIGNDGLARVISAHGGASRSLGLQARSLDWQPLTRSTSDPCPAPRGSATLGTSNPDSELSTSAFQQEGEPVLGFYGCVRALDQQRLLFSLVSDGGYPSGLGETRLSGRFALVGTSYSDRYGGCSQSFAAYDIADGDATSLFGFDCSYYGSEGTTISRSVTDLAVDSSGFAAWRATHTIPEYQPLSSIDCPSLTLCVAGDGNGSVASSTDPTSGRSAWSLAAVDGNVALPSVSCPSTDLCVVAAGTGGNVLTSTDPSGGVSSWTSTHVDDSEIPIFPGNYVSCPSTSLCVLADDAGNIVTSTNPAGGASTWSLSHVDGNAPIGFTAISCPSVSLCVATDAAGNVLTSTDPTGGASAWASTHIGSSVGIPPNGGVSCPSVSLCVIAAGTTIFTSTDPTGGASAWTPTTLQNNVAGNAVSCPTTSLCVAVGGNGQVITSTDPTGGASAWQPADADGNNILVGVSCPSATRCVAVDTVGNVVSSDDPTGGSGAWSAAPVDVPDCAVAKTPCIVENLYARDDHGSRVVDSTPPGGGKSIANVSLSGDSATLSWTHDGLAREATLG
jgi:hypothetical protein